MPSMTINYTVSEGTRFANELGKSLGLVDGQGAPRAATPAECKSFVIAKMKQFMNDTEAKALADAAAAATTSPEFEPT